MLNFQLMTDKDRKEAALLERKRAIEEERKKRIFNPRTRLYGVDYEALEKQLAEKHKREAEEREVERFYSIQTAKYDEISKALDLKEREERRRIQQEINEFRKNYQKPEDRREFDLNDPNYFKKLIPARLRDDDPRCGISSAQKFEGEDLASDLRYKVQREQIKAYLDQQMLEREAADKERKAAEEAYKAAVMARDQRAVELDVMEKECRKKLLVATCRYNKALADEREFQKRCAAQKEKEDSTAEMYNMLTSDLMTENPDQALSNLGKNRRIGYMYKGMNEAERAEVRAGQLNQIAEAKARREFEKRLDLEWQAYNNGVQKSIQMMDKEIERKKRESEQQIMEENRLLGVEQKNHKEYLNKVVYTNKPTAAYFDQFNKSTR
ncbi:RIB43A-like with coiled-coils protein 1 [Onthophagus taurus]|uniref:RIB43A-like with coiled-coils protein 1 n=1 Tax=Onthophagus taurus TaxID=166361 RepID=UPI000C203E6C|nr:RIB43A-like with coiled-coils protein 2 [Onthophagus taurus]